MACLKHLCPLGDGCLWYQRSLRHSNVQVERRKQHEKQRTTHHIRWHRIAGPVHRVHLGGHRHPARVHEHEYHHLGGPCPRAWLPDLRHHAGDHRSQDARVARHAGRARSFLPPIGEDGADEEAGRALPVPGDGEPRFLRRRPVHLDLEFDVIGPSSISVP